MAKIVITFPRTIAQIDPCSVAFEVEALAQTPVLTEDSYEVLQRITSPETAEFLLMQFTENIQRQALLKTVSIRVETPTYKN